MELDFSYVHCLYNIYFTKLGKIIIMGQMEYGLEAERLWFYVLLAL